MSLLAFLRPSPVWVAAGVVVLAGLLILGALLDRDR